MYEFEQGEIKATGFNEAVDNLYQLFEEGKVYYITKARVNIAKKQFSNLTNDYEIMFENQSEVTLVSRSIFPSIFYSLFLFALLFQCEDQDGAPQVKYNFVSLADLADVEKDSMVDVLGIVKENGELGEITAKASQKQIKKRELTIVDKSGYSCRITLWGKQAENWSDSEDGIFAFKGAKVGDFGGKTLSMGGQSSTSADPDIPEAHELRGWYASTCCLL
jgi:replication factor A1